MTDIETELAEARAQLAAVAALAEVRGVIEAVEQGPRITAPDGSISGYYIGADRWRELRAVLTDPAAALAAALSQARAEAWDEGYECGRSDEEVGIPKLDANPYRRADRIEAL